MKIDRKQLFLLIWSILIGFASLTPVKNFPNPHLSIPHLDKIIHFILYSILTILFIPTILKKNNYFKSYLISFVAAVTIGVMFEFLQEIFTAERTGSVYDAISNLMGSIFGLITYHFIVRKKRIEKIVFKIQ